MNSRQTLTQYMMDRPESLDVLTERERRILIARESECEFQQRTLSELGKEFGVTKERIRQIHARARRRVIRFLMFDERKCEHCDGKGWV